MALKENIEAGSTSEDTVLDVDITAYLKNHFSYVRSIPPTVRDDTINSIDLDIQMQLAILLRSLKLVKEVYEDMPTMIKFFFNELLVTIKRLPPLSLSTYWEDNKKHLSNSNSNNVASLKASSTSNESSVSDVSAYNDLRSYIGISSKDNTKKDNYILPLPELAYLKDSFSSNNSHLRDVELNEFDPLGIVMNVFEIAEQFAVSLPIEERGPPLSICLALAIKSGRISLILHTVHLILYNGNGNSVTDKCDIDVELLNDVKVWLTNWAAENKIQLSSKINGSYDTAVNNGILLSFGKADQGKLGHGDTQLNRLIPTIIESLQSTSIKKVVSMSTNTLALDTQGNIYVWGTGNMIGANGMHNTLNGNRMDLFPAIIDNCQLFKDDIVVDISCGLAHTLFLTANGKVYARGNGGNGRLGLNDCVDRHEACLVNFNSTATSPSHANAGVSSDICIKTIQCGACHSLALTTSGTLYTWGKNTQGQCGLGVAEDVLSPTLNKILSNNTIVSIAAGWEHSACVSSDGSLYTWGSGYKDSRRGIIPPVLGHGNNDGKLAPEKISSLVNIFITNVTCGWDHCLALDNKGRVLSWGSGQNGKLGNGNEENVAIPCYIPLLENIKIVKISAGSEHSACISEKGVLYTWGHGDGGRLGHGDNAQCLLPSPVIAIGMMNAVPFDLHCGDKFTMLIVHQTAVKEEAKAAHADTSNIEFSQEWTHRHVDRLTNAMSIEGGNKASVNREQLGSILLSLAARCSNIASSNHYNTRYGIECSNRTFANMLRILELYKCPFVASAVTSNEQTTKSLVNTSNFEQLKLGDFDLEGSVNLDDSIDSVSHTVNNSMVFQDDSMADIRDRTHLMRRTLLDSATAIDVISPLTSVLVLIKQNLAALVKQYSNFIKQSKGNKSDDETTSSAIITTQNTSEQLHGNEINNDEVIDDDDLLSRSTSASGFSSDSYDERERDEGDINDNNLENNYDARASDVDIRDDTSAYNEYSADVMRSRDRNTDSSNPVGSHSRSNNNLNNLLAPNSSVDNLSPVENEGSNNSGFVFDFRGESIGSRAATRAGSAPGSRRGSRGVIAIGGASAMSNNNVSNNNASNNNRGNNPLSLDCNLEESMDESVNNNAALLSPGGLSVSNDDLFNDLNLGNQDGEEADLTEGQQMYQARFFKENEQMSVEDIVSNNQNPMLSPCLSADSLTELANISSSERPSMKHSYRDRESSFDRTEASDSELETSQEGLSFNFLNNSNPMNGEYFIDDSAVANVEVQRAILSSMETMYDYNSSNKGKKLTTSGNKEYYDSKHYYFDMNSEQVLRSLKESVMQLSLASYNIIKHYSSINNNDSAAERVLRGSIEVWKHCQEVYANGFHVFYGNNSSLVSVLQSVIKTPLLNLHLLPGICDGLNEVKKAEYKPKFVETIDVIGISCDDLVSVCAFHQKMFLSTPTALKSVSEDLSSFPPAIITCLSTSLVSILSSVSSSIILNSLKIGNYADVDSLFSKFTDGIVMEMELYSKEVAVQTEPQLQTSFGVVFLREFVNLTNSIQTEGDKSAVDSNGIQKICHITPACILLLLPHLLKIFVKYSDIRSNANGQYIELLHKEMLELVPSVASCIHNLQRLSVRVASIGLKKQLISTTKLFDADLLVQKYFDNNCTIIDEGYERDWFRNFHCVYSRHGSFFNPKFTHVGQVIELNRERASSGHISTIVASSLPTYLNCLNNSNGASEWLTSAEFWNKIFTANTPTTNACIQKILNNLAQDCSKHADGSASRNKTANFDEHSNMRVLLFLILQLLNPAPNSCSKDVADATEKENCVNSCILSIMISNHFLNDIISYGGETDTWMKLLKNVIATVNSKLVYLLSQPLCSSPYRNTTVPLLYSQTVTVDAVVHNVICLHSHIRRASGSKSSVSLTESNDYRLSEYFQRNNESANDGCSHVDLFCDLLSLVLLSGSKAIDTASVVKLILNNEIQRRAMILSIRAMGRFFASSTLPMATSFMNIMLKSSWNHRDVTYYFEYDASSNYFGCMVDAVNTLDTALVHLLRAYKFNDRDNVSHNIDLGTAASKVVEFLFAVLPNKSISSKANSYPLGMNVVTIITKIFVDLLEMLPSLEKSQPLGNDPMVIDNIEALLSAIQTTLYHLNNLMGTNNSSSNSNGVISYLTVLNKALRKLGQLSLSAVSYFQTFLVLCKKLSVTFIMPSLKLIQSTSPTIAMNVFTPQGDYTLGFWLWIPSTVASFGHQDHNNYKVHILSRIQETGDLNFVSLVGAKSITSMMTNPTVILSYEEGDAYLCVYVSVNEVVCSTSTNSTKAKRVKTTKKISLKSSKVVTDQWIHCAIDLCQTKSNDIEKTEVSFFINGAIVDKGSTTGSRSQLHQNMVIGTIPCDLQSNNVSACKPLAISDIYWMSSSASSASSNETKAYIVNGLSLSDPPSTSVSMISSLISICTFVLKSCSVSLGSLNLANNPDFINQNMTMLLSFITNLVDFAVKTVVIGDDDAQSSAFQCLNEIVKLHAWLLQSDIGDTETSVSSLVVKTPPRSIKSSSMSPNIAQGSAMNVANSSKAASAVRHMLVELLELVGIIMTPTYLISSVQDTAETKPMIPSKWLTWLRRILHVRDAIDKSTVKVSWLSNKFVINENLVSTGVASVLCTGINCGMIESSLYNHISSKASIDKEMFQAWYQQSNMKSQGTAATSRPSIINSRAFSYLLLIAGGGILHTIDINSTVDINPRALFLQPDPKGLEICAFPSTAVVAATKMSESKKILPYSSNASELCVVNCAGVYMRKYFGNDVNQSGLSLLIPNGLNHKTPLTEMITVRDPFPVVLVSSLLNSNSAPTSPSDGDFNVLNLNNLIQLLKRIVLSTTKENAGSAQWSESNAAHQEVTELMLNVSNLRLLLVQLSLYDSGNRKRSVSDASVEMIRLTIKNNLSTILQLASTNPADAVSKAFDSGLFKGAQLDILKNLLKEGDIGFLERIGLRSWKQLKYSLHLTPAQANAKASDTPNEVHMTALEGDVQLLDTKLKALSHFPSVRLQHANLEKMSGRWYYECTLLSDGLMQIGWASALFRCDPVCGQGVGDHLYSWAFDGLRMKKWNVSCEPYGKRWQLGDTVGTLVDMDLLDIRFYLNGEDLGSAFSNFVATDLFPALSLNVRQSVRVNFGQSKFMYPPDEIDGKPFRPVCMAVVNPTKSLNSSLASKSVKDADTAEGKASSATEDKAKSADRSNTLQDSSIPANLRENPQSANSNIDGMDAYNAVDDAGNASNDEEDEDCDAAASAMFLAMENEWRTSNGGGDTSGDNRSADNFADSNEFNPHIIQLRRQALIENLIGMGFPVEWSLRAAEHCDAAVSESAAIAWILERMEFEQNKIDELEGDGSRLVEEEIEMDLYANDAANLNINELLDSANNNNASSNVNYHINGLEYIIQRHAAATAHHDNNANSDTQSTFVQRGNMSRAGNDEANLAEDSDNNMIDKIINEGVNLSGNNAKQSANYDEINSDYYYNFENIARNNTWNTDVSYHPIMIGRYTARHRHDLDKQEVLTQVSELEPSDMIPIVASCQLSLCIFYARDIITKLISLSQSDNDMFEFVSEDKVPVLLEVMKKIFRHSMVTAPSNIPDRLFPSILNGNASGDPKDRYPLIEPFVSSLGGNTNDFIYTLSRLEELVYAGSFTSLVSETSAIQSSRIVQMFIQQLIKCNVLAQNASRSSNSSISSDLATMENKLLKGIGINMTADINTDVNTLLMQHLVEDCVSILENACNSAYENYDWILAALEREDMTNIANETGISPPKVHSNPPSALWAYNAMRSILIYYIPFKPRNTSEETYLQEHQGDYIIKLITSDVLARLLRVYQSSTISLKFIIFDIISLILSRINLWLRCDYDGKDRAPESYKLQLASDFYISISKQKYLLLTFGARLRVEGMHRQLYSRYTRSIGNFLLQWQSLKRALGLLTYSHVHEYLICDWVSSVTRGNSERLDVTQISSTTITVSWNLQSYGNAESDIVSAGLYITMASSNGLENPLVVLTTLPRTGNYRIDNLHHDTMYKITISFDASNEANSENKGNSDSVKDEINPKDINVYTSTEGEKLFFLDPNNMSPNLTLGSSHLFIRHKANKRWSTARASVKMTNGIHKWDVRIDRCISKNIFIGVSTADARLDNYVGCDKYGWAFLANKAIWHNKSKLKGYGELFRTGDVITVSLDLDAGTLSYALNGKDLGVAIDGLVGQCLYPSFSLYNEDDQLSIIPCRQYDSKSNTSISNVANSVGNSNVSSSTAERVLDRLEALQCLFLYFYSSYNMQSSTETVADDTSYSNRDLCLPLFLSDELSRRWEVWESCNSSIRSTLWNNDFVSICMSKEACQKVAPSCLLELSATNAICPKDTIIFDDASRARVLGGACHRLWLQSESSGEVMCLTKDTLTQLVVNKSISLSQSPHKESQNNSTFFDAENFRSTAGMTKELTLQRNCWSKEKDVCLAQWLDVISRTNQMNPLNLVMAHITAPRQHIIKYVSSNCSLSKYAQLYSEFSDLDLLLRSLVIIHMNDLLLPMLPFLSPHDGEHLLNHPSSLLYHLRDLVFMSVRGEFFFRMSQSSQSYTNRTATSVPNSEVKAGVGGALILEIKREETVLNKILQLIDSNSYENKVELPVHGTDPLALDDRWRLLIGIQASLIGQMYQYFETLSRSGAHSSTPAATTNPLANNDGTNSWENVLRTISYRSLDDRRSLADREVPFSIRSRDVTGSVPSACNHGNREDDLFYLLEVANAMNEQADEGIRISEWSIFSAFVAAAAEQANSFIVSIFHELYTPEELKTLVSDRIHSLEVDKLSAGEINLLLQYLHALGVLVGLCIRSGVLITLSLPEVICKKFGTMYDSDHADSKGFGVLFHRSAYLAIRQGVTSIFPESAFVLLSQENMLNLFRGACPCTNVALLQSCCVLEGGLTVADPHIKHFFMCLQELNPSEVEVLLKLLWDKHRFIDEIYYIQSRELPAPFHIIPPTAMALLSPDEADIIIFSDRNSISVPRYSSISVMHKYILKIINGSINK